jgi:hypothetical protein
MLLSPPSDQHGVIDGEYDKTTMQPSKRQYQSSIDLSCSGVLDHLVHLGERVGLFDQPQWVENNHLGLDMDIVVLYQIQHVSTLLRRRQQRP